MPSQEPFVIRRACADDIKRGHLDLLAQLTVVGEINPERYAATMAHMSDTGSFVYVVHDTEDDLVVASATLLVEQKLIHSCACVGHIEDVVVGAQCRGKGLGQKLINHLVEAASEHNCYKVILDCSADNAGFYEKCGFVKKELQMRKDCR